MLQDLALILIFGVVFSKIFGLLKLPDIVGMIIAGVFLSNFELLSEDITLITSELRNIALILILLRAGLSLDLKVLKKSSKQTILMSFLPAILEIFGVTVLCIMFFDVPVNTALIAGATVSAVSPAIIVPKMIRLIEEGYAKTKNIPQMILASASIDDIFVIILFYSFVNSETTSLFLLPVHIMLGVIIGLITANLFVFILKKVTVSANLTTGIILGLSFILLNIENYLPFSALLSVIVVGVVFNVKMPFLSIRLTNKYNDLWAVFSVILFVIVGISLKIEYLFEFGYKPFLIVVLALIFRSIGVFISLLGSNLSKKERIFCVFAFTPKATVQAGIGAIPLALGLPYGELILTISVVSIVITAPIGAFLIEKTHKTHLIKE